MRTCRVFLDNWYGYQKLDAGLLQKLKQHSIVLHKHSLLPKDMSLEDFLCPSSFVFYLNQRGIEKYNAVIGGKTLEEGKEKIQGVNEIINLYRQQNDIKARSLPRMKKLYNQILADRESLSFLPDQFESDAELFETLGEYYAVINNAEKGKKSLLKRIEEIFAGLNSDEIDAEQFHIRETEIDTISRTIFGRWDLINLALVSYVKDKVYPVSPGKKVSGSLEKKREKWLKKDTFTLAELEDALTYYQNTETEELYIPNQILKYFQKCVVRRKSTVQGEEDKEELIFAKIRASFKEIESFSKISPERNMPDQKDKKGGEGFRQIQKIKEFMDSVLTLLHFMKPLYLREGKDGSNKIGVENLNDFYIDFETCYEELMSFIRLYNKVRNYLTKKSKEQEKFKINFDCSTLLDGWDVNKEGANQGVILIRHCPDGKKKFFLGIIHKTHKDILNYELDMDEKLAIQAGGSKAVDKKKKLKEEIVLKKSDQGECYQKMVYKFLPDPLKMLPKVFFSKKRIDYFEPSQEIQDIKEGKKYHEDKVSRDKYIDFFKQSIKKHPDWKEFNFVFRPTEEYESMDDFYSNVAYQGYSIRFDSIKAEYIDRLVQEGKLFLFEIYNKDFSQHSKGKPNLHTSYWRLLFDEKNLQKTVLKLNGQAEMFFRFFSIPAEKAIRHKKNQPIKNKNPHNSKKASKFSYDLVKDKRFTKDAFFLHVPITLNYGLPKAAPLNQKVNLLIKKNQDVRIMGIDRGERNLLYYSIIDGKGKIIAQESLNKITNSYQNGKDANSIDVVNDYHERLAEKEKRRDESRKSWATIENIKELKAGYLSQVVHKICQLIMEHQAIVVMEDLNQGFKRGRFKVEKQVYQKFEKTLIDKLNYLVFKNAHPGEAGHYLRAYQLTDRFTSFKKLGKQSGVLFYIPAANTSKIDPATGFIPRGFQTMTKDTARKFLSNFQIRYNRNHDYFEFTFSYADIGIPSLGDNKWTVCTHDEARHIYSGKEKKYTSIDITRELKDALKKNNIKDEDYAGSQNIINELGQADKAELYNTVLYLLRVVTRLRYGNGCPGDRNEDYILSPVANNAGQFFDSRAGDATMPLDADANGAYHIALKGLWILNAIRETNEDDLGKPKLNLNTEKWQAFARQRLFSK